MTDVTRSTGEGGLRAVLDLARISNAPTVVTNVVAGAVISVPLLALPSLAFAVVAAVLLYIAGMALNDVVDARIDQERGRTDRPIPGGRLSRRAAALWAIAWGAGGLVTAGLAGIPTLITAGCLVIVIIAYDMLNKRFAGSVVIMGLCRGLAYAIGAASQYSTSADLKATFAEVADGVLVPALAMTAFIAGITMIARSEHLAGARGRQATLATVMLPLPILAAAGFMMAPGHAVPIALMAGLGLVAAMWIAWSANHLRRTPPGVGRAITGWLAGICLADAFFIALSGRAAWAWAIPVCFGCFVLTIMLQRRIAGT